MRLGRLLPGGRIRGAPRCHGRLRHHRLSVWRRWLRRLLRQSGRHVGPGRGRVDGGRLRLLSDRAGFGAGVHCRCRRCGALGLRPGRGISRGSWLGCLVGVRAEGRRRFLGGDQRDFQRHRRRHLSAGGRPRPGDRQPLRRDQRATVDEQRRCDRRPPARALMPASAGPHLRLEARVRQRLPE